MYSTVITLNGELKNSPQRYYFNKNIKVVGILSHKKGEWLFIRTHHGVRTWNERDVKEIDYREFMRCARAVIPDNRPRYYIREWKYERK